MATEVVKVVDPGCGSDADYTSLAAWVAGEQRDLPAAAETAVAECRATGDATDTAYVHLSGFVTDADHPVTIRTAPDGGHRHRGVRGSGYWLKLNDTCGGSGRTFDCCQDHVSIEGIGFDLSYVGETSSLHAVTFVTGTDSGGESDNGGSHRLDIVAVYSEWGGITVEYGETSDFSAVNLIAACGTSHAALQLVGLFNEARIYNSVLVGGGLTRAMLTGRDYFKNCYATGGYNSSSDLERCASNTTSGSPGLQNVPYDNTTFVCTTLGAEDLHLAPGSALSHILNPADSAPHGWQSKKEIANSTATQTNFTKTR